MQRYGVSLLDLGAAPGALKCDGVAPLLMGPQIISLANAKCDLTGLVTHGDVQLDNIPQALEISDLYVPGSFVLGAHAHDLSFKHAVIDKATVFNADIGRRVDFLKSTFYGEVVGRSGIRQGNFANCNFHETANFSLANFNHYVVFDGSTFHKDALFTDTEFQYSHSVSFKRTHFKAGAHFRSSNSKKMNATSFSGASFDSEAGFEGREFASILDFRDATFARAPRFQDAKISFESYFPEIENFLDWKVTPKTHRDREDKRHYYQDAVQCYRSLRSAMKDQEAHDEEAKFWELEMRARERYLTWAPREIIPKIFSKLYGFASRYGNSAGRPLFLWFLIWAAVAVAIYCAPFFVAELPPSDGLAVKALDISLQQTIRPFSIWSEEGAKLLGLLFRNDFYTSPTTIFLIRIGATLQTLASLTLLALFGFALRRKFRMA